MWQKSYEITVSNLKPEQVWKIWSDIKLRPLWDNDNEWATLEGGFQKGGIIHFKVKGGPKLKMVITDCIPNKLFTDYFKFFGARMYGIHEMKEKAEGLQLTTTMKIIGPLSWLWKKVAVEKIVASLPHQTNLLIELARKQ